MIRNAIILDSKKNELGIDSVIVDLEKNNHIKIVYWFGGDVKHNKLNSNESYLDFVTFNSKPFDFTKDKNYIEVYNKVRKKHIFTFINQVGRRYMCDPMLKSHLHKDGLIHIDYYDVVQEFNITVNKIYRLISENNVELIIDNYLPHNGNDYLLYLVAKEMGVKFLSFYSLMQDGKNYLIPITEADDIGEFKKSPKLSNGFKINVDEGYEKNLPYMKYEVTQNKSSGQNVTMVDKSKIVDREQIRNDMVSQIEDSIKKIENFKLKSSNLFKILILKFLPTLKSRKNNDLSNGSFIKITTLHDKYKKSLMFLKKRLGYYKALKEFSVIDPDLSRKFVYFPLHLQPECNTDPMGGIFSDQLLAIEMLSLLIPDDWLIYVKENPKQECFQRGQRFFDRFKSIRKAVLLSTNIDTYTLIDKSQFTATITGTVGWESITGGKSTLIFGNAWYKKFDGVFEYDKDLEISKIINHKISHKKIQKQMNKLSEKMFEGESITGFLNENFDYEQNRKNIYNNIIKIMNYLFKESA